MPRRLLVLTAILSAILCVAIALTRFGQMLPVSRALSFNPPGCELPCVLNIIPGVTTDTQANNILAATTSFHNSYNSELQYQINGDLPDQPFIGVKYLYPDTPHYVYCISILTKTDSKIMTLGQLLQAGHSIHRIIRSSYASGMMEYHGLFLITFDKNDQIIAIVSAFQNVDLSSAVIGLYVVGGSVQSDAFQTILAEWRGDEEIRWLGFTTVQRYWTEPSIPWNF